jgi:hypothetical protein
MKLTFLFKIGNSLKALKRSLQGTSASGAAPAKKKIMVERYD